MGIAKLRASGPVVEIRFPIVGKVWITTTQELAGRVSKESDTFSLRKRVASSLVFGGGCLASFARWPTVCSPWMNRTTRGYGASSMRPFAVARFDTSRDSGLADQLASDLFADGSPADLVDRYARQLPLSVICELLGLPLADRPKFIAWTNSFTRLTGLMGFVGLMPAMMAMRRYIQDLVEVVRANGGEGLIAELVRVEHQGGRISPEEVVAMVFLLLGAGTETTTHLISGSVYELLSDPSLRDWLEQDWSRTNLAIEEFLRFISPVQFSKPRLVRRDVELDGIRIEGRVRGSWPTPRPPITTPMPTSILSISILTGAPTGTSPLEPASIFASVISSLESKASVRSRRSSIAGRSSHWPSTTYR